MALLTSCQASFTDADESLALIPGVNLSPFWSHDIGDVYHATSNPEGYWSKAHSLDGCTFTQLSDGWLHLRIDNSGGSSTKRFDVQMARNDEIKAGEAYTFLAEYRNNLSSASSSIGTSYMVQTNKCQFWGSGVEKVIEGDGSATSLDASYIPRDGSIYRKRYVKLSEAEDSSYRTQDPTYLLSWSFQAKAGMIADYEFRFSMYAGEYLGPYIPFVISDTSGISNAVKGVREDLDNLSVGGTNLLLDSKKDAEESHDTYNVAQFDFAESLIEGEEYTVSWCITVSAEKRATAVYHSGGTYYMSSFSEGGMPGIAGTYVLHKTFTATANMASQTSGAGYGFARVYVSNNEKAGQGSTAVTGTAHVNWIKIEKGNVPTDWSPAPQDMDQTLDDVAELQVQVHECYTEITKTAEEIKSSARDTYVTKTSLEEIQEDFESSITQTSQEIRMDFQSSIDTVNGRVSENQALLEEYIRFRGALIELGKVGNAFTAELSNEMLAFLEDGQIIAYISNQSLVITNAEIRNKLSLGNFEFIPRASGNLSIVWRH